MSNHIDIEKLKKISEGYRSEYSKLNTIIRDMQETPKKNALVGKCFRHINTYGGSGKPWFVYSHVTGYDGDMMIANSFQQDTYHKYEFEYDQRIPLYHFDVTSSSSMHPITHKEYLNAKKRMLGKVNKKFREEKRKKCRKS